MNATDSFGDPKATEFPNDKEMWIQNYAVRILIRFRQLQTLLEVKHSPSPEAR